MNPEVFLEASERAEMALLETFDLVVNDFPRFIELEGENLSTVVTANSDIDPFLLAESVLTSWAWRLPDDAWHSVKCRMFFDGIATKTGTGAIELHLELSHANHRGVDLRNWLFCEAQERALNGTDR